MLARGFTFGGHTSSSRVMPGAYIWGKASDFGSQIPVNGRVGQHWTGRETKRCAAILLIIAVENLNWAA